MEARTDINLFAVMATLLFSKSCNKVADLQKDQSCRLDGLLRLHSSEVIKYLSQQFGCLDCMKVHKTV